MNGDRSPLVVVFGGSRAVPAEPDYLVGLQLGALLVERGFRVATGGYGGLMEAVSKGAKEAGGAPIGVTFPAFGDECNPFVSEQRSSLDLFERLRILVLEADAFVLVRGGMGTLAELMLAWIHVESGLRSRVPIVLLGECWPSLLAVLRDAFAVSKKDLALLASARSPEDAIAVIEKSTRGVVDQGGPCASS